MLVGLIFLTLFSVACGVFLLFLPRGRRIEGTEPRCAACGYIVYGLPGQTCPECGADLARPGAVVVGGRRPPGRVVRSISWSLFCLMAVAVPLSAIWSGVVGPMVPRVQDVSLVLTFARPMSNAYRSIELRSHSRGLESPNARLQGPSHLSHEAKIDLTRSDGTVCTAVIDDAVEHFRDAAKAGSKDSLPLDAAGLTTWLQANGVGGNADQINREMADGVAQMRQAILHPEAGIFTTGITYASVGSSRGSSSRPQAWVGFAPPALVAIVWLIGLIRIVRKPLMALS